MSKKIAIVTPTFPPYRGGIGKVAEMDAVQIAALGYDVHVYAPNVTAGRTADGYALHRLRPLLQYGKGAFVPAVAALFSAYDLVILHYPFFGGAEPLALAAKFSKKAKYLLVYHMDVVGTGALRPFIAAHSRMIMPSIVQGAARVVVTSFDHAESSRIAPSLKKNSSRVSALAPSVDANHFSSGKKSAALLAEYAVPATAPVAVFVGGLDRPHYFKGIPVLLHALAAKELSRVHAVIVGDGELRPTFEALARSLGVAHRVTFAGNVSEEHLPDHIRLGDVFVFPSTDRSEAFGIAALEALSCGVPVIASDLPGVRTIVRDRHTGLLVPPGSSSALALSMAELLSATIARQQMGDAARRMVTEEYASSHRQKKWETILDEVL